MQQSPESRSAARVLVEFLVSYAILIGVGIAGIAVFAQILGAVLR